MSRYSYTERIALRDVEPGMELVLQPEGCPVRILGFSGGGVHIQMPDGRSRFVVPASSLRRVDRWRAMLAAARAVA